MSMRTKLNSKLVLAIFALVAAGFGATACSVDSSPPVDEQIFEGRLQSAQIHRFMEEDLRQLAPGETVFIDLTEANVGLVIEYTDASLLERVRVRDASGEFILADRMTTITASDGPSRVIMASDQELQMELAQAKAIPSLDAQLAKISCICKECHIDGTILHCTGCLCWQN
jgi:hypothetical protein